MSDNSDWTIMSDQQKGLSKIIAELFRGIENRNCARTEVKCEIVDNNLSEAFNNTLLKARSKPIVSMLEDISVGMMKRIGAKKSSVEKWNGQFGSFIMKKLNDNILESVGWEVDFNGDDGYEIKKGKHQFKVSSQRRSCSCRYWDLTGITCAHAICAIFDKGKQPEEFVHDWYSNDVYIRTYSHVMQPINGEIFWLKTQNEKLHASAPKKMNGRPKKRRKKEESEPRPSQSTTQLSRKGRVMTCALCKQKGHNKRNCHTLPRQTGSSNARGGSSNIAVVRGGSSNARGRRGGLAIYTNPHTREVTLNVRNHVD
ncbi:PREDICTED: uncharacterized protein LOC109191752 [Ipomoea nil]|uniref:uncharacterized protein LOC109191752 n=1 Tax=Ipomoea nil TaxID=35883 RepID=UPI000901B993|nr:PREDICTED: uncharacterized protein LOC109191752 [Ipomoea nil]